MINIAIASKIKSMPIAIKKMFNIFDKLNASSDVPDKLLTVVDVLVLLELLEAGEFVLFRLLF